MDADDDYYYYDDSHNGNSDGNNNNSDHDLSDQVEEPDDNGVWLGTDDLLDPPKEPTSNFRQNYTILSEPEVRQLQEKDISELSNLLSISAADSCTLLCHYNWNTSKIHDQWFAEEPAIRKLLGPLEPSNKTTKQQRRITCLICFDKVKAQSASSASCGHQYCTSCWQQYIHTSVDDGPGCLLLQCPEHSCKTAVGQDMINILGSGEDKVKYACYLLRSYVEVSPNMKWCPYPDCSYAVRFELGGEDPDIQCKCGHLFCWSCGEEAHRPVDCETVRNWILKNSSESENTNWILAYCKPCPKCHRQIEKNAGCMHMTCRPPCKHEFCWLCFSDWRKHNSCNRYKKEEDEDGKKRKKAKRAIDRYTHYYERWANNRSSRQKSLADLREMETVKLEKLRAKLNAQSLVDLSFLIKAWEQISECRRLLMWTYAYGYYIPEKESGKKQLFEHLQDQAESVLEQLHKCAEKEVQEFFDQEPPTGIWHEFKDYKNKLAKLTQVSRNYFQNLVDAFENGLKEVSSREACHPRKKSKKAGKRTSCESTSSDIEATKNLIFWTCGVCTYNNEHDDATCKACGEERDY